jgi:hypothetical protein
MNADSVKPASRAAVVMAIAARDNPILKLYWCRGAKADMFAFDGFEPEPSLGRYASLHA